MLRAIWKGEEVCVGDRWRVDKGVKVSGFFTTMRLCVGVINCLGVRLDLEVGVDAWENFLRLLGVLGSLASFVASHSATSSSSCLLRFLVAFVWPSTRSMSGSISSAP